jgi:branched-chain amino acid transport system permease protein
VLRPLVGQNEDTLLMATIGLAFIIEGVAQLAWGVEVRRLDLGIRDEPMGWLADKADILVSQLDIAAGLVAGIMVAVLALVFSKTKVGRGLRAVADDNAAALSIGIPIKQIWVLVWAAAGVVALVAGMLWGARSGVQFALVGVALKAMPVLIIGGFTSVPGVIVAGLIVGAAEKMAEVYVGPFVGGGIEGCCPMCWQCCSCWSGPKACSARKSFGASDAAIQPGRWTPCSTEKPGSTRRVTRRTGSC